MNKIAKRPSLTLLSESPRSHKESYIGEALGQIDVSKYNVYKETDRRKSFVDNNWSSHIQYIELAQLGFYFTKKPDSVKCAFCYLDLSEFEPNDEPLKEHLKFSPNCPLLRRRETYNEPLDFEALDKILPPVSYDECGSRRKKSRVEDDVAYPDYRLPSIRMKSFETWPVGIKQRPEDLCEAGFFYSGQSDVTVCFSCGLYVGKWDPEDNVWVEHDNLRAKECNYLKINHEQLKMNKQQYENRSQSKAPVAEKSQSDDEDKIEIDPVMRCKICLDRKSSTILLPCQHVAICGQCVFGIGDKCPICRSNIDKILPLYYA